MMSVSLNSSMRTNLLSLQNIADNQALIQNKIATGLKVNSPINNPNAYYTAITLQNRANDLNIFMDSIGQSIQALKNVDNTISTGINFLEQALAAARITINDLHRIPLPTPPSPEPNPIPPLRPGSEQLTKDIIEKLMKDNGISGVIATTSDEFDNAVNNAKEGDTIVIMGKSFHSDEIFNLDNVNLSGAQAIINKLNLNDKYYIAEKDKAIINFSASLNDSHRSFNTSGNVTISDVTINYDVPNQFSFNTYGIIHNTGTLTLENVNFDVVSANQASKYNDMVYTTGTVYLKGEINVNMEDNRTQIFHSTFFGKFIQNADDSLNIKMKNDIGSVFDGGTVELLGKIDVTLDDTGSGSNFISSSSAILGGIINIKGNSLNFANNINTIFKSNLELSIFNTQDKNYLISNTSEKEFIWEKGAKIIYNNEKMWMASNSSSLKTDTKIHFTPGSDLSAVLGWDRVTLSSYMTNAAVVPTESSKNNALLDYIQKENNDLSSNKKQISIEAASSRFNNILDYYNDLILENNYLGNNLLQNGVLRIKFSSSDKSLKIMGNQINFEKLGINKTEWKNENDIEKSVNEIQGALNELQKQNGEYSNYLSIISERDSFMNSLSNILTEGADKLILADINEDSAKMLSLKTRQMLANNALSLASQASKSILFLF